MHVEKILQNPYIDISADGLSALPETRAVGTLWLAPWRHSDACFGLFPDRFRSFSDYFSIVFEPFCMVSVLFFSIFLRRGAMAVPRRHRETVMAAWHRHSASPGLG